MYTQKIKHKYISLDLTWQDIIVLIYILRTLQAHTHNYCKNGDFLVVQLYYYINIIKLLITDRACPNYIILGNILYSTRNLNNNNYVKVDYSKMINVTVIMILLIIIYTCKELTFFEYLHERFHEYIYYIIIMIVHSYIHVHPL